MPKNTSPNELGEPIGNELPDWEPEVCISHEVTDMAKFGGYTHKAREDQEASWRLM